MSFTGNADQRSNTKNTAKGTRFVQTEILYRFVVKLSCLGAQCLELGCVVHYGEHGCLLGIVEVCSQ